MCCEDRRAQCVRSEYLKVSLPYRHFRVCLPRSRTPTVNRSAFDRYFASECWQQPVRNLNLILNQLPRCVMRRAFSARSILLAMVIVIFSFLVMLVSRRDMTVGAAPSFKGVLTYHNDVMRTGWNASETTLTLQNVNSSTFGKAVRSSYRWEGRRATFICSQCEHPGKRNPQRVVCGQRAWHRCMVSTRTADRRSGM